MQGCLKFFILLCLYLFLFALLFTLIVLGLGFYGIPLAVIGAILAYYSPNYRNWLSSQPGYSRRLATLPGLQTTSPTGLAIATLAYLLPLSLVGLLVSRGTFSNPGNIPTSACIGLIGIVLLYGWLIQGWRLSSAKSDVAASQEIEQSTKPIGLPLRAILSDLANPVAASVVAFAFLLPICFWGGIFTFNEPLREIGLLPTHTPVPTYTPIPTNTPTSAPALTARPTSTPKPTNTPKPTVTPMPTNTPEPTVTPDSLQLVRSRVQEANSALYDDYAVKEVWQDQDTLTISAKLKEGSSLSYTLQDHIVEFLRAALVDCEQYRLGTGTNGCRVKETAPYKYVKVQILLPNEDILASVRYTVGDKKYFTGIDGTRILEHRVFELADEYYLQGENTKQSSVPSVTPTKIVVPSATSESVLVPTSTLTPVAVSSCPNPGVQITSPAPGSRFDSRIVVISGNANIPNFASYKIEYSTDPNGGAWNYLLERNTPVDNNSLMELDTSTVPDGPYGVRLTVIDLSGNYPEPCIVWFNDSNTPATVDTPANTDSGQGPCSCGGDFYNCPDFSPKSEAQACFNYCVSVGAGDIHDLDRDSDGKACE